MTTETNDYFAGTLAFIKDKDNYNNKAKTEDIKPVTVEPVAPVEPEGLLSAADLRPMLKSLKKYPDVLTYYKQPKLDDELYINDTGSSVYVPGLGVFSVPFCLDRALIRNRDRDAIICALTYNGVPLEVVTEAIEPWLPSYFKDVDLDELGI